ncbi:phage minor capsid protein [Nocardiopsis tropica]|uniref:Phage minor capsid protein n=1 Tax=Nocardiopsis tropica TaxID=109330 RepID=A0ABU7KM01_9ACTN|nr:phage minor capsid protein [Nocardiopsis umidischolae]MEE2050318.1 phage minor capsid protein [Nocardiopsis umidischolae]
MPGVDPDDLEDIVSAVSAIYQEGELALYRQISRHLQRYPGAPTASVGEPRLEAVGQLRRSVEVIQAGLLADGTRDIRAGLARAWQLGTRSALVDIPRAWFENSGIGDRAEEARRLIPQSGAIEALATAVVRDVGRVVSNILRDALDAYRSAVAGGAARMLVGGQTRREATQAAWARLVQQGVFGFTDRANRRWRLHSYVEMAMRTASARAAVQGQDDRLETLGIDLVYISDHVQECSLCRPWEGKILHREFGPAGPLRVEHGLNDDVFLDIDVAGTIEQARAAGLWHPNCRHSMSGYIPGVTRVPVGRPDPDGYRARMRQRHIERRIRRWKEQAAAATTDRARTAANARTRAWQAAMRQHLADHPSLKRLRYREQPGAGSTPPRDQAPDTVTPIGPDVQPTLDGTGGEQVRRLPRTDDEQVVRQGDEQVPGQGTLEEAAAEAERERQEEERRRAAEEERLRLEAEARARMVASDPTRERINAVHAQLPRTAEDWAALIPTRSQSRLEETLEEYRTTSARIHAQIDPRRRELEAAGTPTDQIEQILDDEFGTDRILMNALDVEIREMSEALRNYQAGNLDQISDYFRGELEATTDVVDYPTDDHGNLMPPPALLEQLDGVLDVGHRLLDDAEQAMDSDPELIELRSARDRARDARDWGAADAVHPQIARRESEILRTVLASVVDLGGHQQRVGDVANDAPSDWEEQLRVAEQYYPTSWLRMADAGGPLDIVQADRQYYLQGSGDRADRMAVNGNAWRRYDGAFESSTHEVTVHEQGHRMEQHIPGLTYLEFALTRREATQEDGNLEPLQRLRDLDGGSYSHEEVTYRDFWANPYTGKTYEARNPGSPATGSWELFQTGTQDAWGRSSNTYTNFRGVPFVLGALASLQRRERVELLDPPLETLSEEQLTERLLQAFNDGEVERAAELEAEIDRRAEAERAREEASERRREAAQRRRQDREEAQYAEVARLVEEEGWSWEEAAVEVLGGTLESARRQEYTRTHRAGDSDRRSFRDIAREQYQLYIERRVVAAEQATRGFLLTPAAQTAGIDPASLFSGPRARAERHASEELKRWWDANGRLTFQEFVDQIEQGRRTGDPGQDYNR